MCNYPAGVRNEVETIDLQLEVIGVLDPQIDAKPLLEVSALQRLETDHEHFGRLDLLPKPDAPGHRKPDHGEYRQ